MEILEKYTIGKRGIETLNEDRLVITDDFIAVLDGATPKKCPDIDDKSAARFAVEVAEEIIKKFPKDINSRGAIDALSEGLKAAVNSKIKLPGSVDKPSFVCAIYSKYKKQIWRVHDVHVLIDGEDVKPLYSSGYVTSLARALYVELELLKGIDPEQIRIHDTGRDYIMPLLECQYLLANNQNTPSGYGVVNGDKVPGKFIEIFDVEDAEEVIIASDGYHQPMLTLEDSEDYLSETLELDPLLYKEFPATKCYLRGQVSFDDRTYVRFKP